MKLQTVLLAVLASAPVVHAAERLQVTAEDHGAGRFRILATLPGVADVAQAQAILHPVFQQVCGTQAVTLGRYRFESVQPLTGDGPTSLSLQQDLQCGDAAPTARAPSERAPPGDADEARVRIATRAFLDARDAGDLDTARRMYAAETRALLGDEWATRSAELHRGVDTRTEPRLLGLHWTDDPAGVPPGRYVAVDYVIDYDSGALGCGYVAWRQASEDRFEIVRSEEGHLSRQDREGLSADAYARARRSLGCRD